MSRGIAGSPKTYNIECSYKKLINWTIKTIIIAWVGIPMIRAIFKELLVNNLLIINISKMLDNRARPKEPRKTINNANLIFTRKLTDGCPRISIPYISERISLLYAENVVKIKPTIK
tara:strand:+ start:29906 stop:30256 length:351 start_codon:yes stop_codon:yes gene_type:complete